MCRLIFIHLSRSVWSETFWKLDIIQTQTICVLCFGYLGWTSYSIYKSIKGEEIGFGNFLSLEYLPLTLLLLLYLNSLMGKRFEIDKVVLIKRKNPTDYFKNNQQQQKEWIEKSMWIHPQFDYRLGGEVIVCGMNFSRIPLIYKISVWGFFS